MHRIAGYWFAHILRAASNAAPRTHFSQTNPGATILAEGSVLCLEDRTPLGRVEDVFGPVVLPFYALRHYTGAAAPPNVKCGVAVFSVDRYAETLVPVKLKSKGYAAPQCATHGDICAEAHGAPHTPCGAL